MTDATVQIIIAVVAALATVVAAYYGAKKAGDVAEAKQDAKIEENRLMEQIHHEQTIEAIGRLEKKQDKYNNLQERVAILEAKGRQ